MSQTLTDIAQQLRQANKKVQLIYAFNGTGKTSLLTALLSLPSVAAGGVLLLAPTGTTTLATGFWAASDSLDYAAAAPYAVAMILLSAPLTWLIMTRNSEDPT